MMREVSLIKYLPQLMQDYDEIKRITTAENPEFQALWDNSSSVRDNLFILTADETGVSRYEQSLKIYPSVTDSLEIRKARILIKINEQPPFTVRALENQLRVLCGADNFAVDLNVYTLNVDIFDQRYDTLLEVIATLKRVVPANIVVNTTALHDLPIAYVDIRNRKPATMQKVTLFTEYSYQFKVDTQVGIVPMNTVYKRVVLGGQN